VSLDFKNYQILQSPM